MVEGSLTSGWHDSDLESKAFLPCKALKHELRICRIPKQGRMVMKTEMNNLCRYATFIFMRTLLRPSISVEIAPLPKLSTSSPPYCSTQYATERKSSDSKTVNFPPPKNGQAYQINVGSVSFFLNITPEQ